MSALQLFSYSGQEVRTQLINGEPWFVLADLCKVLDIANVGNVTARLDEVSVRQTDVHNSRGQLRQTTIVNESGMYEVVLRSDKPEAKAFRRWLTSEVIPEIRRTGSYSLAPALPQSYSDALRELASSVEAKELAEKRAKELETPANAWNVMVAAGGDYSVEQVAKMLSRDEAVTIGRNRLFTFMQSIGWIYRHGPRNGWHAYQPQVDNGRLVLKMSAAFLNAKTGEMENPSPTIRITAKGVDALRVALATAVAA